MLVNYGYTKNPSAIRNAKPLVEDDDIYDYEELLNSFVCEKFDVVDRFHLEEEVSTYLYISDTFYEIYTALFSNEIKICGKPITDFIEPIKSVKNKKEGCLIFQSPINILISDLYMETLKNNDIYLCIIPIRWDSTFKKWHFLVIK